MNTSKTILFFGTDDFSVPTLQALIDAHYSVVAVVTKPDSKQGRGQILTPPAVKVLAEKHGIPVWQPTQVSDITDDIRELQPVVGVLSSYGKIIPQSILDLFEPGIINVHPSLLPKYRGPSPIESAITNGDRQTGVSIMQLTKRMDAGPVYRQEILQLAGTETHPILYDKLSHLGANLLVSILPAIIEDGMKPTPQEEDGVSYSKLLKKSDAFIDPSHLTADEIERRVRAYTTFPRTKYTLFNQAIIITKAHVAEEDEGLSLKCRDGRFLAIDELIGPSGKRMSGADFKNGYAAAG